MRKHNKVNVKSESNSHAIIRGYGEGDCVEALACFIFDDGIIVDGRVWFACADPVDEKILVEILPYLLDHGVKSYSIEEDLIPMDEFRWALSDTSNDCLQAIKSKA